LAEVHTLTGYPEAGQHNHHTHHPYYPFHLHNFFFTFLLLIFSLNTQN